MAGHDTLLLVVARCVAREFEDLSGEVLEDGREVDWRTSKSDRAEREGRKMRRTRCASADTLRVVAALEETVDTANGELEARLSGAALRLGVAARLARGGFAGFALSRLQAYVSTESPSSQQTTTSTHHVDEEDLKGGGGG